MNHPTKFNLLINELFSSNDLTEPEAIDSYAFKLDENSSLHIDYLPRTDMISLSRRFKHSLDSASKENLFELLTLNGFTDDPVKRGVCTASSRQPVIWIQAPVSDLSLQSLVELIEEISSNSFIEQ